MPNVERAGRYKGRILEHRVTRTSKAGLPQYEAKLEVFALYDRSARTYNPINPPQHINAFILLFRGDKSVIENQVDNLKEALGWDGQSLKALSAMKVDGKEVSVTVEVNEGVNAEKYPFRVAFINPVYSGNGGGSSRALPEGDLEALDREFGVALKARAAKADDGDEALPY